jgi:hypothetical protein
MGAWECSVRATGQKHGRQETSLYQNRFLIVGEIPTRQPWSQVARHKSRNFSREKNARFMAARAHPLPRAL